jgi:hypothetical protein
MLSRLYNTKKHQIPHTKWLCPRHSQLCTDITSRLSANMHYYIIGSVTILKHFASNQYEKFELILSESQQLRNVHSHWSYFKRQKKTEQSF